MAAAGSQKEWKQRETELAEKLAILQAQLSEVRAEAVRTKEEQLSAVLTESQAVSRMGEINTWRMVKTLSLLRDTGHRPHSNIFQKWLGVRG